MGQKGIIIEGGRVHNVGYRLFLLAKARRLAIPNYEVENVEEGGRQKVIVSVGGGEKQVREFTDFVKSNYPKKAEVSRVREIEPPERVMPIDDYDKVLAAEQQNTVAQAGLAMLDKQDQMLGKQDKTIEEIKTVGDRVDCGFTKTGQDFSTLREDY